MDDLCSQLNLRELEKEVVQVKLKPLEEVITKESNCLIAKLQTSKTYNCDAFKNTMRNVATY